MANRIKGITIEIGGDTTGLDKALSDVNRKIGTTQRGLSDVTRLLKLDPGNTVLLAQKQDLLTEAIKDTSEKLKALEQAQGQVEAAFKRGDIGAEKYQAFQREVEATRGQLGRYQAELEATANEQAALRESAGKLETAIADVGDAVNDAADTLKGGALLEAADQLSGVGDKIAGLASAAVEAFGEADGAISKVNAYFGETGREAEQSAGIIKSVFESGVGDSMDAVATAVVTVKENLKDLDAVELENLTKQALQLDDLYGIDMNETLRGVNSLMGQFGISATEAMDYIVRGTQNGLDKTNELGDNLSEYAGKFAQAGYSADEYFQLLQNGLDGGAYNLDKVNDAINEVTTRLADGTIGDAIGSYSTETQNLFAAWQNGGATQKQVIDSIVRDIAGTTSQQEALNLAAQAFGTMAEDGSLKFITALTSVGDTYRDVSGAAQEMSEAAVTPMQEMEGNARKVQDALAPLGEKLSEIANTVLPPVTEAIQWAVDKFNSLPEPVQNFTIILAALTAGFTAIAPIIAAVSLAMGALEVSLLPIIGVIAAVAAAVVVIIEIVKHWGEITDWFSEKWAAFTGRLSDKMEAARERVSSAINAARDAVSSAVQAIYDKAFDTFNALHNGVVHKFNQIRDAITGPIETAREIIAGIVERMKNLFNFEFSVPRIKLPHFAISPPGWSLGDLLDGVIPSLGIDWYKNGGIMMRPTAFGVNGNSLLAGGEAGPEAILPLDAFYNRLSQMLDEKLNTGKMEGYLSQIAANSNRGIYLDGKTLVGRLIPAINRELETIAKEGAWR